MKPHSEDPKERATEIAQWIVNAEGRRDGNGHIRLYKLPPADGGGTREYAGINDRYHPEVLARIVKLVDAEKYAEAEQEAVNHIREYTDVVMRWNPTPPVEAYLRDSAFNRGPKGALRILQIALGVADDGKYGPVTDRALRNAERYPERLLKDLRAARETYERRIAPPVGKRAAFWDGLKNRWQNAFVFASEFIA